MHATNPPTGSHYSPHDQLPAPEPSQAEYLPRHFYNNTAKHLIKDTVRIMMNGVHIDLERVIELEEVLNIQLEHVSSELAINPLIKQFLILRYSKQVSTYRDDRRSMLKSTEDYIKPFNPKDMLQRSYFMNLYAAQQDIPLPTEEISPGIPKWPVKLVKKLSSTRPLLARLLANTLSTTHPLVLQTVNGIAQLKTDLHNKSYLAQIASPQLEYPAFNPGSPKQKAELFESLDITCEKFSKDTGLASWDRDQVERVFNETLDPDVRHFTQCFIDHSFAAIVRNNFIEAFYKYTVDGRLYGQYKLLGAKSGRYTSSNP